MTFKLSRLHSPNPKKGKNGKKDKKNSAADKI
jgi:hypothetical protein